MLAYNVRVKDFLDGQQVTIYSNSIISNVGKKEKRQKEFDNISEPIQEPFTKTAVQSFELQEREEKDKERSVSNSMKRTKNKIVDYSRTNVWEWFLTLTIREEEIRMNYDRCSEELKKWIHNMQNQCNYEMKYIIVPELHERGGFHFHALVSNAYGLKFVNSGHRTKDNEIIYNIDNYGLGFTTATKIKDTERASNYITKYITKELAQVTKGKKRYWNSKNLDIPNVTFYNYDTMDKNILKDELIECAEYMKTVDYDVCTRQRSVTYYEVEEQALKTN